MNKYIKLRIINYDTTVTIVIWLWQYFFIFGLVIMDVKITNNSTFSSYSQLCEQKI